MNKSKLQSILFAVSVIAIVIGAINMLLSAFFGIMGGLLGRATPEELERLGITVSSFTPDVSRQVLIASNIATADGVLTIVMGALGVRASGDASKVMPALVASCIVLVVHAIELVFDFQVGSLVFGLVAPAVSVALCEMIRRKAAGAAQDE